MTSVFKKNVVKTQNCFKSAMYKNKLLKMLLVERNILVCQIFLYKTILINRLV